MAAVAVQRLKPQRTGDEAVGGTELASQHMQKRCRRGQAAGMAIVQVCFCLGCHSYKYYQLLQRPGTLGGCTSARLVY